MVLKTIAAIGQGESGTGLRYGESRRTADDQTAQIRGDADAGPGACAGILRGETRLRDFHRPAIRRQTTLDRIAHRYVRDAYRAVHARGPRESHRDVLQWIVRLR